METVIVTLKLPVDLFNLVKKYAKAFIVNEQFSNTGIIKNTGVLNNTRLENQQVSTSRPSLSDVVDEVKRTNSNIDPSRFFTYYEERNWLGKDGKPFDWKRMLAKWGTYGLEKAKQAPTRNAPATCDFTNDASFKSAIQDLLKEGVA